MSIPNSNNFPVAEKITHELIKHGDKRNDPYYWMRLSDKQKNAKVPDEHTKRVLAYLNAENEYTSKVMAHTEAFQESLFNEIVGRIKKTDMSVPYYKDGFYYLTEYKENNEYPYYKRKFNLESTEFQLLLDVNKEAQGKDYIDIKGLNVSPNNKILAYGEDDLSRRIYKIKFKNIESGEYLHDVIENTTGNIVWANDNKTIFYTQKDSTLRAFKIFKHKLGTPQSEDMEVYHEVDETFNTYVYKTKDNKFIIIGSFATISNEYRILDADTPNAEFTLFQKREPKHEFKINHFNGSWYIITNKDEAHNFKIMKCPSLETNIESWVPFIDHDENIFISYLEIFKNYLVINARLNGLSGIRVIPWNNHNQSYWIEFNESVYDVQTTINKEFNTETLRFYYSSMTTPSSTYEINMSNKKRVLLKQQEVIGDFDSNNYKTKRVFAEAQDGTNIPISLVYNKNLKSDQPNPLLLYGYGSYGHSIDPYFSSVRLSLLDRGFVFAIAHIRGGQEMGRKWYEDGKMNNKKNSFTDFISCAETLISKQYTSTEKLFCMGGSAGGLLIGAVLNMNPEIWKGAIAAVPFVDVVTTMLDDSIPLTTGEYNEWGNPNHKEAYNYIKSYSPYDNIEEKDYPSLLVTTGYHDSQVQYWEPAKWVAKLRDRKTDSNVLLLHTIMEAGHGGKSGRFERYRETALEYAFLLMLADIKA